MIRIDYYYQHRTCKELVLVIGFGYADWNKFSSEGSVKLKDPTTGLIWLEPQDDFERWYQEYNP